eukprot:358430-Chlamydomonas_euryale.AAC.3
MWKKVKERQGHRKCGDFPWRPTHAAYMSPGVAEAHGARPARASYPSHTSPRVVNADDAGMCWAAVDADAQREILLRGIHLVGGLQEDGGVVDRLRGGGWEEVRQRPGRRVARGWGCGCPARGGGWEEVRQRSGRRVARRWWA